LDIGIDGSLAKRGFQLLKQRSAEIEAALGQKLVWEELPENRGSRISLYMPGDEKRDNRDNWNKQQEWLLTWAPKLSEAVRPVVRSLEFGAPAEAEGAEAAGN
jgi:Domain of unknown function (DUF4268)